MGKFKPEISIIIPIQDDKAIINCIRSIDEPNTKIVLVLNGSNSQYKQFIQSLIEKDSRIDYYEILESNIGMARNLGCLHSQSEKLIMMDSDCVFEPKSIHLLKKALDAGSIAKGTVKYDYNSFQTKLVAKARETHCSDISNVYTPMLAFRKLIINKIGGYYFSSSIPWTEDHELAQRVKKSKIEIIAVAQAVCWHQPTTIYRDFKNALNYGTGYFKGISLGLTEPSFLYGGAKKLRESIWLDMKRLLNLPFYFIQILRQSDLVTALYMTIWMIAFTFSYNLTFLKRKKI